MRRQNNTHGFTLVEILITVLILSIGLLAGGARAADIVAGVFGAIAGRVAAMVGRRLEKPVAFTGGVAMLPGMDSALAEAVVSVLTYGQTSGADTLAGFLWLSECP